jgi:ADP-heptose:LPS heptosyltransferase
MQKAFTIAKIDLIERLPGAFQCANIIHMINNKKKLTIRKHPVPPGNSFGGGSARFLYYIAMGSFFRRGEPMLREYLNPEEFKIAGELPLLIKLRLKAIVHRHAASCGSRRILVIDTCIIGDFIGTLPALRAFIAHAHQEVDLVVSPPLKPIAESVTGVHAVYTARSIYRRTNERRSDHSDMPGEYGRVLVLRISHDAYEMLSRIRYAEIMLYDIQFIKYFAHIFWSTLRKKNVRQWRAVNFDIVGIEEPATPLAFDEIFTICPGEYDRVRALPEMQARGKRIILHMGSGWRIKLWENAKWIEAIRRINAMGEFTFIVVGGGDTEAASFAFIQRHLDFTLQSLINKTDLKTTLLAMRLSDYFIGIDSGPRNMAHLADLRSISLLGPAPKNFMPVNSADIVIDKFTCRCKSLFYFHKVSALAALSPDEMVEAFTRLSGSTARSEEALLRHASA